MALVQKMKSSGARMFVELSLKYCSVITLCLSDLTCHEVHFVFHQYWENSIKNNKPSRRGVSAALEVKISSSATPIPKQWDKYISNCKNKTNLCEFVSSLLCQEGQEKLPENKKIVATGGFKDVERAVSFSRGTSTDIPGLQSNHEEAYTRLLQHVKDTADIASRIVIQSPDTNVLVICTSHFNSLSCKELWFKQV